MAETVVTAGIDVGKEWPDCAVWPGRAELRVERNAVGLDRLAAWLVEHRVSRVGLEASGGYGTAVMDALQARGFAVIRFDAERIRMFAEAKGRLAKNDRADARVIAQATLVPDENTPPERRRDLDPLVEHSAYRRRLRDRLGDRADQPEHLRDASSRRRTLARQAGLDKALAALDAELARLAAARKDWHALERRLRKVPGVGPVPAQTLIASLPGLGRVSRRAIASLVGVAPLDGDGGKRAGERHVTGGRDAVREVLYMAAGAARRWNPAIAAFAKRPAGRKPEVIIVARMRKLLTILNAMARDGQDRNPRAAARPDGRPSVRRNSDHPSVPACHPAGWRARVRPMVTYGRRRRRRSVIDRPVHGGASRQTTNPQRTTQLLFHLRRDHVTTVRHRAARARTFGAWADIGGAAAV